MVFRTLKTVWMAALMFGLAFVAGNPVVAEASFATTGSSALKDMLPRLADWRPTEEARTYDPASLFEYIDGAAEAYISYDFKELAVGNYQHGGSKAAMTVEIYDMGTPLDAFGIYSAERFPESRFVAVGIQGYMEEGSLNFLAGRYYVKLLGYEGGDKTEAHLKSYGAAIASKIKDPASFQAILKAFPAQGLVADSEKYVARNFMGFKFLNRGYGAAYKRDGQEFDAFVIEAKSVEDAIAMLKQFADNFAKSGKAEKAGAGYRIQDAYLKNILVAPVGAFLCGVTKIRDGGEAAGEKVLRGLIQALGRK